MTFQEAIQQSQKADVQGAFQKTSTPYLKVIDGGKNTKKPDQWTMNVVDQIIKNSRKSSYAIANEIEKNQKLKEIFDSVFEEPEVLRLSKFSRDENAAYKIINAERPIVYISEKMANSMGNLSRYLFDTIPNAPIVFENKQAEKKFKTASFCDTYQTKFYNLGYFINEDSGKGYSAPSSDIVICFGEPSSEIKDTFPNADFVVKKSGEIDSLINFATINVMREKLKTATLSL